MDEDNMTGAAPTGDEPAGAPADDAASADPLGSFEEAPVADPMAEGQMPAAEDLPESSEGEEDEGDTFAL